MPKTPEENVGEVVIGTGTESLSRPPAHMGLATVSCISVRGVRGSVTRQAFPHLGIIVWFRNEGGAGGYRTQLSAGDVHEARLQCATDISATSKSVHHKKFEGSPSIATMRGPKHDSLLKSYAFKLAEGLTKKPAMSPQTYIKRGLGSEACPRYIHLSTGKIPPSPR